jgi:predicted dehydrogenase
MSDQGMNRRSFVARTATVVGGMVVWHERAGGLFAQSRPRPLGVALVGLGNLSTNQLAPALQKTTHCRLAGIVTGTPAKAVRWKARYDIPDRSIYDYESMWRMADNDDIDFVHVVTPNGLHADHSIAALRAGKHVLCEKPMEVSVERCEAIIAAAKEAGRQVAIGYRCQFEPHHLELVRLARERTLGEAKMIEAGFGFTIGDPNQWRLDRELSGGGPLVDVGVYALQSARMITGEEPTRVSALTTVTDPVKFDEVEESMTFQLGFPSGVLADCRTSYRVRGLNGVTVYAERGSFGMEPAYNYGGNRGWRSDGQPLEFEEIDMFAAELDDFATCIMNGTPTRVPGEEGLRDVSIMMAAYEAARTGRSVMLG